MCKEYKIQFRRCCNCVRLGTHIDTSKLDQVFDHLMYIYLFLMRNQFPYDYHTDLRRGFIIPVKIILYFIHKIE